MINDDALSRMKPNAFLINCSRGPIVDTDALVRALDAKNIAGCALDTTDPEPLPKGHALWTHPRCVVTPHTAGGSPRRADRIVDTFCENLRRMRDGRPLVALVDKQKGY